MAASRYRSDYDDDTGEHGPAGCGVACTGDSR